jgi:hypothetical protein
MEMQNLWPDFAIEKTKSPKAILKEQAGYLMGKTNNVLSAEIETIHYQGDIGNIIHAFYVVAPEMNNYRYRLFGIKHKVIDYYPLVIDWEGWTLPWEHGQNGTKEVNNEKEFIDSLREIIQSPLTTRTISYLFAQSTED